MVMTEVKGSLTITTASAVSRSPNPDETYHYVRRGDEGAVISVDESTDDSEIERRRALSAFTVEEETKLLHRIDWHLMPLCALLNLIKNLDANSASNARIMNLGTSENIMTQLGVTSDEYGFITVLYTIPYILCEVPSNLLFKKMLPSRWQARIMFCWGVVTACHAAATNKGGLYTARFFLGLAESGMFPGIILHMTYWYRPDEMSLRLIYLYVLGQLSNIVSSLLAFGLDGISGRRGLSGWQWLFLIEGVITVFLSIIIWFCLPDFPATASWLSETEKAFVQARLPPNAPRAAEEDFNWKQIVTTLKDKRLWLFTLNWGFFVTGNGGVLFYQPTVIADLGFTTVAQSQILNIPMAVCAMVLIAITGIIADRGKLPRPVLPLCVVVVVIACYAVLIVYPSTGAVYATIIIANSAARTWFALMWPWRAQTTSRATGSAFAIGFVNSYGQVGDAIGPQLFQERHAPKYQVSFAASQVLMGLCGITMLYTWWVTRQTEGDTRKLKRVRVEAGRRGENVFEDVEDHDLERSRRR